MQACLCNPTASFVLVYPAMAFLINSSESIKQMRTGSASQTNKTLRREEALIFVEKALSVYGNGQVLSPQHLSP